MSRLDLSVHPALTEEAIENLFKRKIFSCLSFVETDPELIARISGLQYSKVLIVKNAILTKFSSPLVDGFKHYNEVIQQSAIISTGIPNLDKLLDGGFMTGQIYELCGPGASGKTQICMTISVNITHMHQHQTLLYVDTKNELTGHRILEIMENRREKTEDIGDLMNKIKIARITSARNLLSFLHDLSSELKAGEGKSLGFRLLIIDSIASPFFRFLGRENHEALVLLNQIANVLHFIAVEYHVVVLLTNLVSNWTVEMVEDDNDEGDQSVQEIQTPVLGKYWIHVPDTRLNVKKLENSDKTLLVVMKSTNQPIGKTTQITLSKSGAI